jgi:hypothetical protein
MTREEAVKIIASGLSPRDTRKPGRAESGRSAVPSNQTAGFDLYDKLGSIAGS